ncbi:hypothetical protein CR513_26282, partial [Mucuna pruriens]
MGKEYKEGLDSIREDTQSVNAKVEALSKNKEEEPKVIILHESEGRYDESRNSERSESSRTLRRRRSKRRERDERNNTEVSHERNRMGRENPRREKLDMGKCKIPLLLDNSKSEVYLDWELKVEQILGCFDYYGRMVVRFVMFITLSVEEYHKEKKMNLMRAQIADTREATMTRFFHEELVYKDIKVELQIKRRDTSRNPYPSSSSWKGKKRGGKRSLEETRVPRKGVISSKVEKRHHPSLPIVLLNLVVSNRAMVLKENGEVESESSCEKSSSTSEAKTSSESSHREEMFSW